MTDHPKRPNQTALQPAENVRQHWAIRVEAEHTIDDALHPTYLWHWHEVIQAGDLVEFSHELHRFYGLFYVTSVNKETASVILAPLNGGVIDLKKAPVRKADLSGAHVKFMGALRWCVLSADGIKLKTELPTRPDAEEWLEERRENPQDKAA